MGAVRSIVLNSLLASVILMLTVRVAESQWIQLVNFPNEAVTCIYFLDDIGFPSIGFAGAGGDIYRSVDGGANWANVLSGLPGQVTSFCFKNANTGWCTINGLTTSRAIYSTNNGGTSWTPLNIIGDGSDVYYNQATKLLFLSLRMTTANSMISADGGVTWKALNNQTDANGFAFCNPTDGILSAHTGSFFRTSDGGQTWTNLNHIQHSWSPCAIPGTSTFVSAMDLAQNMFKSVDAGVTWTPMPAVGNTALTGCVEPGICGVYVQMSDGIYLSPSLSGWTFLNGPGNAPDTRFFAGISYVYAGDGGGNIFKLPESSTDWPTVKLNPISVTLTEALGCPPQIAQTSFENLSCIPLNILNAWVTDSSQWSLAFRHLPLMLNTNDTIQFHLTGTGKTSGTFRSSLELTIQTAAGTADTSIPLTISVEGIVPPTIKPVAVTLHDQCASLDTVFSIKNNHCDTVSLTSLSMLDTTLFNLGSFTLPVIIPPDSELIVPVHARPKSKGSFGDTAAITLTYGNFELDTTVALEGKVGTSAIAASYSDSAIALGTLTGCQSKLDTVYFRNNSCDSEEITLAQIGVLSKFKVVSLVLDKWLPPGDSIAIVVELPGSTGIGNFSDQLRIILSNGTFSQEFPIPISGSVVYAPASALISANDMERDSIPPCGTFDTMITMTLSSPCADSLMISQAQYSGSGSVTVTSSPQLPLVLYNGDTVKYLVSYSPKAGEAVSGNIEILVNGIDTSIPVHFSAGSGSIGQLSIGATRTTLSAKFCDEDSVEIELYNTGCVSAVIDSIALQSLFPNQTQFQLAPISLPLTIPTEDSIPIKVFYSGDGIGDGSASIIARETGGKILTQSFSGSTIPVGGARVGIALSPQSTLNPLAGKVTTPYLYFADAVPSSSGLLSLDCNVAFNANVLSDLGPIGQNGWSVQELSSSQTGLSLAITRTSATQINAGDEIATLPLMAFVSDSLSTPISLTSVNFSPSDPNYERCTLAASIDSPSIDVQINQQCGDSELSAFLRGDKIVISSVQVKPNPFSKNGASELIVSFVSSEQAFAAITISDVLGRIRATLSANASAGSNSIDIPTINLDEGVYYVDLEEEGTNVITRVAVIGDR